MDGMIFSRLALPMFKLPLSFLLLLTLTAAAQERISKQQRLQSFLASKQVEAVFDQPYAGTENPRQRLDLYLPEVRTTDQPLPVIVYIHGGGWSGGDRIEVGSSLGLMIAQGNYVGVSVGYRLSNEAKWPAQIHDCKAAIRWLRGHAREYHLDPDRIGVWGTSAGGHLVSLLGTSGGVEELEGDLGEFTGQSSRVACVVNFCGPQDFMLPLTYHNGQPDKRDAAVEGLLGGDIVSKHDAAVEASPVTYITPDDPPMLTAHGTKDLRVAFIQAEKLDAELKKAGVSHVFIPVTNGGHSFRSAELNQRMLQFFDLHLRGLKAEIPVGPVADELQVRSLPIK